MTYPAVELRLPAWVAGAAPPDAVYPSPEARMRLAIRLARTNIERQTGGPFGAAIFERATGRLVSVGVNLVESLNCSTAHAEMVAIMIAQRRLGRYTLGAAGGQSYELASSAEPCAMCLGALPWAGLAGLACGARGEDAGAIGFDEGAKPADWVAALERRGIRVTRDVCRAEAAAVLADYRRRGGLIYNGSRT